MAETRMHPVSATLTHPACFYYDSQGELTAFQIAHGYHLTVTTMGNGWPERNDDLYDCKVTKIYGFGVRGLTAGQVIIGMGNHILVPGFAFHKNGNKPSDGYAPYAVVQPQLI